MPLHLVADFATPEAFVDAVDLEVANGGLLVRGGRVDPGTTTCMVDVRLAGESVAEVEARIGQVGRTGVTVVFDGAPSVLLAKANELRAPAAAEAEEPRVQQPRGTIADRLAALTVPQKVALALSGDRETRMALLKDHNKTLHAFVLRNPRIGLDEALFAAKLSTLAPDALKNISEHPQWGHDPQIITALVRNVRSPLPVALRLLPKLSSVEIRAIAKGGARDQLVYAARKLLSTGG